MAHFFNNISDAFQNKGRQPRRHMPVAMRCWPMTGRAPGPAQRAMDDIVRDS